MTRASRVLIRSEYRNDKYMEPKKNVTHKIQLWLILQWTLLSDVTIQEILGDTLSQTPVAPFTNMV